MAQKKSNTTTGKRSKVNDLPMKPAKAARVKGGQLASATLKKADDTASTTTRNFGG